MQDDVDPPAGTAAGLRQALGDGTSGPGGSSTVFRLERGDVVEVPDPADLLRGWAPESLSALDRLALLQRMIEASRTLVAEHGAAARADGATWQQIGGTLGMSRQAAHERFA